MFMNATIPWFLWPVFTNFSGWCSGNECCVSVVYRLVNKEEVEGTYSLSTLRSTSDSRREDSSA